MIPAVSITVGIGLAIAGWFGYQHYRKTPGPSETEVVRPPPPTSDGATKKDKEETPQVPTTVTLAVTGAPPQSQVYLNDQYHGQTDANGRLQIPNLPKGKYTLKLKKEGHLEWTQGGELTSSTEIPVQLVPVPPVTLTVSALPGCAVYLDDRIVATTDANGQAVIPDVRQGTHSVKVSRDGYEDWAQTIQLTSDQMLRPTLVRLSYEQRVQMARSHISAGRLNQALSALQELIAEEPNRPEGYELMGEIYDTQNNFSQAREMLGRAVEQGGQAQFPVTHDHLGGSDPVDRAKKEWKDFCLVGEFHTRAR
jgi:tetratricopeptide (TPR) repeat protein